MTQHTIKLTPGGAVTLVEQFRTADRSHLKFGLLSSVNSRTSTHLHGSRVEGPFAKYPLRAPCLSKRSTSSRGNAKRYQDRLISPLSRNSTDALKPSCHCGSRPITRSRELNMEGGYNEDQTGVRL